MAEREAYKATNAGRTFEVVPFQPDRSWRAIRYRVTVKREPFTTSLSYVMTPAQLKALGAWVTMEIAYRKGIRGERDYGR